MSNLLFLKNLDFEDESVKTEGLKYLETLFGQCTKGYIEIRPFPVGSDRKWIPINNITNPTIPEDKDIYVGVATREKGKGTKEDIVEIPAVWVDIDFKDTTKEEVEKHLDTFKLEPSIVVNSGRGLHLYWILKNPATYGDVKRIEDINRRIVKHFGGDKAAVEAARILRLPGTYNQKYNPARLVILESTNDYLYDLSDFDFLPPAKSVVMAAPSAVKSSGATSTFLYGVHKGERHNKAVSLAGRYSNLGLSKAETQSILSDWNQKNTPPLLDDELNKTVEDIYKRYKKMKFQALSRITRTTAK